MSAGARQSAARTSAAGAAARLEACGVLEDLEGEDLAGQLAKLECDSEEE